MDDIDIRILRALQTNPLFSIHDISRQLGISNTRCWRKLKQIENAGIIIDRAVLIDQNKVDLKMTVFANIKLKHHDENTSLAVENAARDCPEIVECFSMTGGSDYVCRVIVRNLDDYQRILKNTLLPLPGISSINSSVAFKKIKLTTHLPL